MKKNKAILVFAALAAGLYFYSRSKSASAAEALPGPPSAENEPSPVTPAPVSYPDMIMTATSPGLPQAMPVSMPAGMASVPGVVPVSVPLPIAVPTNLPPATPALPTVLPPNEHGESPVAPAPSATLPSIVDDLTGAMLRELLTAEQSPGWKRKSAIVGKWQKARGLKSDQMFGKKSAIKLAEEVGTIPLIRFWAKGDQPQTAVEGYRDALEMLASQASEPRHAQLLHSAQREQGQGFASNPTPPTTLITI